jgi:hypothetical protein
MKLSMALGTTTTGRGRWGTLAYLPALAVITAAVTAVLFVATLAAERVLAPRRALALPALRPVTAFAPALEEPSPAAMMLAPVPPALLRALAPGSAPPPAEAAPAPVHRAPQTARTRPVPDSLPAAPPLEHIEEDLWQP